MESIASSRKLPDDLALFETYRYEVQTNGKRGALARSAKRYAVSDQYVSNIVKRFQAPPVEIAPDDLYDPSTNAYAAYVRSVNLKWQQDQDRALLATLIANDAPAGVQSPVGIGICACDICQRQRYEFKQFIPGRDANAKKVAHLMAGLVTAPTTGMLVLVGKNPILSLLLFFPVLGLWWCVLEAYRCARMD